MKLFFSALLWILGLLFFLVWFPILGPIELAIAKSLFSLYLSTRLWNLALACESYILVAFTLSEIYFFSSRRFLGPQFYPIPNSYRAWGLLHFEPVCLWKNSVGVCTYELSVHFCISCLENSYCPTAQEAFALAGLTEWARKKYIQDWLSPA